MTPQTAVITGASTGIGRATADEFAEQGYDLAILARRKELLDAIVDQLSNEYPERKFAAYRCDVREWEQVSDTAQQIQEDFKQINVLINNAGAFEYLSLEKSAPEKLDEMIDVNVRGVVYMTKAMLPLLRKAVSNGQWAKIVNVSSIAGLWGFSNMSVYTATKFAVTGFSSGLRRELRGQGIRVASIHPGPVRSKADIPENAPKKRLVMSPYEIADQVFSLATSKRNRLISHPAFTLLNAIEHVSPTVVDKFLKKFL